MTETEMKPKKKTARQALTETLQNARAPLAVHELDIIGHSQNNLATELSGMAKEGLVVGRYRPNVRFKEWLIVPKKFSCECDGAGCFICGDSL